MARSRTCRSRRVACAVLAAGIASGTMASPAMARPGDNLPSGSFIYQRDVPTRPAEGPDVPAPPDYVVLGGKSEVFAGLGLSAVPDAEQAGMSGSIAGGGNLISDTVNRSLEALTNSRSAGDASMAGERGSFAGGVVGQAMGSLQSALGAMRTALGSDR